MHVGSGQLARFVDEEVEDSERDDDSGEGKNGEGSKREEVDGGGSNEDDMKDVLETSE